MPEANWVQPTIRLPTPTPSSTPFPQESPTPTRTPETSAVATPGDLVGGTLALLAEGVFPGLVGFLAALGMMVIVLRRRRLLWGYLQVGGE